MYTIIKKCYVFSRYGAFFTVYFFWGFFSDYHLVIFLKYNMSVPIKVLIDSLIKFREVLFGKKIYYLLPLILKI